MIAKSEHLPPPAAWKAHSAPVARTMEDEAALAQRRLDLGACHEVYYAEFDGLWRRRLVVTAMGD